MKSLMNFKWLMAALLLCAPLLVWGEDEVQDITLSLDNLTGWGNTSGDFSYNSETHVATFPGAYCGVNLYDDSEDGIGIDYSAYAGVKVVFKTKETYDITLDVNYPNKNYCSATKAGSGDESQEQEIYVAFDSSYGNVIQIYLMCGGYYVENSETGNWDESTPETSIEIVSATVLVNAPETTVADEETLVLSNYNEVDWEDSNEDSDTYGQGSGSFSYDNDANTATLTFTRGWGGLGWSNPSSWNLTDYDAVEVTYENLTGGSYIQFYLQEAVSPWSSQNAGYTSETSGTMTYKIADHSGLDYSQISSIVIQTSGACSVTVTSIKFIKYDNGDSEGTTEPFITVSPKDYLNTAWTEYDITEDDTVTTGSNGQSATIVISGGSGGSLAWNYSDGWDLATDYTGIEVDYSLGDEETANVSLYIKDGDGHEATISGSDGKISCDFSDGSYSGIDFADIVQIAVKTDAACTLTVSSIELVLWLGDSSIESGKYIITTSTTTGDGAEAVTTYNYYLNLGVGIDIWQGTDAASGGGYLQNSKAATVKVDETAEDITAADIVFKGYWCGVEWNYNNESVDLTNSNALTQLVVTYRVAQKNTNEIPNVQLVLKDVNNKEISVYGADATGTITCVFSNYTSTDIDFTQIISMAVQAQVPCTLHILSAELERGGDGTVVDQDILLSQFSVWENSVGNTYEYDSESDTGTITLNSSWSGGQWWFEDVDEDSYFGVYVKFTTTSTCKIRLTVTYDDGADGYVENYTVVGSGTGADQWLFLPFNKTYDSDVVKISIMCCDLEGAENCVIVLTEAELVGPDDGEVHSEIRKIVTSTTEGYGTFCSDRNFQMPENLTGYVITKVASTKTSITGSDGNEGDEDNENNDTSKARMKALADENGGDDTNLDEGYVVSIVKKYEYPNIVPAGIGILVKGCGDSVDAPITYTAYVTDENKNYWSDDDVTYSPTPVADNLLLGYDGGSDGKGGTVDSTASEMEEATVKAYNDAYETTTYTAGDFYYYYLDYGKADYTYDENNKVTSTSYSYLGFYWWDSTGGSFAMIPNRAWLPIPKSNFGGSSATSLKMVIYNEDEDEDETTGITTVPAESVKNASNGAIYNLQGVRVGNMDHKGIYIVDGKKYIKK